jgi:hypothetical protein
VLFIKHAVGDLPVGRGFGGADAQRGGARHRATRGIWIHINGEANRAFLCPFVSSEFFPCIRKGFRTSSQTPYGGGSLCNFGLRGAGWRCMVGVA